MSRRTAACAVWIVASALEAAAALKRCTVGADGVRYCLPTVIGGCCVGSGSTSLAAYMDSHPEMSFGDTKVCFCVCIRARR
jgi:hypothetical protein